MRHVTRTMHRVYLTKAVTDRAFQRAQQERIKCVFLTNLFISDATRVRCVLCTSKASTGGH